MDNNSLKNLFLLENSALNIRYLLARGNRSEGIHVINKSRGTHGEFHHLYQELREDGVKFKAYFRMSISTFDYLLDKIQHKLTKKWTNFILNPITPTERLAVTLRFLATGASFKSLGFTFRMGASTVGCIVHETVDVIWEILQPIHMAVPTEAMFKEISQDFFKKWNFPLCLGAIDGKHCRVKSPPKSGSMFYNYKHYFSIVLQGVADANCRFVAIEVGGYGKQSDGGTFRNSSLFHLMESERFNIPPDNVLPGTEILAPHVLIGDDAYPLLRHLLKPYPGRNLTAEQEYFNMRLSRARRVIECAFGILTAKFRILWKPIETSPNLADKIIKCVCILHNMIIDKQGINNNEIESLMVTTLSNTSGGRDNRPSHTASFVRDVFKTFVCANRI